MPRRSLSENTRWQIFGMHEAGLSRRSNGSRLIINHTVISRLVRKHVATGYVKYRPRSGRPRKTTPRDDRALVRLVRRRPMTNAKDLREHWRVGVRLSTSTIRRRLRQVTTNMSIWTDWLDFIPVVGTIKNTVEAISAVCHGDYDLAKEKGASAALGLVLDVLTAGTEHAVGTAAFRVGEKLAVKGTTEKVVANAMKKVGGSAGAKGVAARVLIHEFGKRSNRPKDPKTSEDEKKKTSRRGEHVINNNVLKVFRTMIDRFAAKIGSNASQLLANKEHTAAYQAYYAPLPEATTQSIRYAMVAHIPEDDHYIDANATAYGAAIGIISETVVTYMYDYHSNNSYNAPVVDRSITDLVRLLNESQLYVDEYAKQYWLHHGGSEALFEESRQQVLHMFRRLCAPTSGENEGKQWVRDLTGHT